MKGVWGMWGVVVVVSVVLLGGCAQRAVKELEYEHLQAEKNRLVLEQVPLEGQVSRLGAHVSRLARQIQALEGKESEPQELDAQIEHAVTEHVGSYEDTLNRHMVEMEQRLKALQLSWEKKATQTHTLEKRMTAVEEQLEQLPECPGEEEAQCESEEVSAAPSGVEMMGEEQLLEVVEGLQAKGVLPGGEVEKSLFTNLIQDCLLHSSRGNTGEAPVGKSRRADLDGALLDGVVGGFASEVGKVLGTALTKEKRVALKPVFECTVLAAVEVHSRQEGEDPQTAVSVTPAIQQFWDQTFLSGPGDALLEGEAGGSGKTRSSEEGPGGLVGVDP